MINRSKKLVSMIMSVFLATSIFMGVNPTTSHAQSASSSNIQTLMKQAMINKLEQSTKNSKADTLDENAPLSKTNPSTTVRVIVQLKDEPAVKDSSKSISSVKSSQQSVIDKVKALTGASVVRSFGYLVNGFSVNIKASDISKLQAIPGVKSVTQAKVYEPDMSFAKNLTQAYSTWKDLGYKGEGMVISIIDTGIDYTHKDMKITDKSTEKLTAADVASLGGKGKYFTDKVPYGYNFADGNQSVIDANPSEQHGMHVAGIVAGNGDASQVDSFGAIQGVAPEAQLLAMKVFSNTDGLMEYASDDDVIAAIEDSVLHKADVINMSLGSKCGFQDANDPEQVAIKNATDQGVLCVISAGNSAISTTLNGWNEPQTNVLRTTDTSTVGAPGLAKDSLCVASYENTDRVVSAFDFTAGTTTGKVNYAVGAGIPENVIKNPTSIVDCGLGQVSDITGKNLTGKVALIKRGGITFSEKALNAQNAGAVGVIVYDKDLSAGGSNDPIQMSIDATQVKIPSVGIGNADGLKLVSYLAKGDVQVSFSGQLTSTTNSIAGQMSPFTSWGPTPSLDFKPEISAPGGNIYSTQNNNKYTSMSGTSMAAPHTSGSEALILEAAKKNLGLSGRELVEYAKNTAINTAKVEMNKQVPTVPYSPRQQGAGLIQIEDAINNPVIVTDDTGSATVALKEVKSTTATFNLNLKNYSTSDATYSLENGGILSEQVTDEYGHFSDYSISGSSMTFSSNTIVVPAKSTAKVTVTVTLPKDLTTERFVEGYVKFASNNAKVPSLSVPYLGYYGDWSNESILDQPAWSDSTLWAAEYLAAAVGSKVRPLGLLGYDENDNPVIDPDQIAFSTSEDSLYTNVLPVLTLLRNAKTMDVDVVDKNDGSAKVLRKLSTDTNLTKDLLEASPNGDGGQKIYGNGYWDGKLYNQSTGKYETAADGQYYLRFTTKIDMADAKPQTLYMPVKIDSVAPTMKITSPGTSSGSADYTLTWTATDNNTSPEMLANNSVVLLNSVKVDLKASPVSYDSATKTFSCKVKLASGTSNDIVVGTFDMAGNISMQEQAVDSSVLFYNLSEGQKIGSGSLQEDGTYMVGGKVDSKVAKLVINNTTAAIDDNNEFSASILLNEGANKVTVKAYDSSNNPIATTGEYNVYRYTKAPTITLTSPVLSGTTFNTTEDTLNITGTVKTEDPSLKLAGLLVNGNEVDVDSATGEFNYAMSVAGFVPVIVTAVDEVGNSDSVVFVTIANVTTTPFKIYFDNLDSLAQKQQLNGSDIKDGKLTISGTVNHLPKVFNINGNAVTVNPDLTFSTDVKLVTGANKILVYAEDTNGAVVYNSSYRLDYDYNAPVITLDSSMNVHDGKLYTNKDSVEIKGTVYDDTYGYSFNINDQYALYSNMYPLTGKANQKSFDYTVAVKNGDIITLNAADNFYNTTSQPIQVVVDKVGPSVTISGVEEGKVYNNTVTPKVEIKAANNEITSQTVTLDGAVYNSGDAITVLGKHSLVATATDSLGNVTTKTVNFTVQAQDTITDPTTASDIMTSDVNKAVQAPGSTVSIDMTNIPEPAKNAVVPQSVLDTMKGHDVNLTVTAPTVNGVSVTWTINGKDITGETKSISVALNSTAENQAAISKLDSNSLAVSFSSTNGVLPAKATLTIKADWLNGKTNVFLYYYNPTTKAPELMKNPDSADGSYKVVNGTVTVTITHCSDYFFTSAALNSNKSGSIVKTGSMINFENLMGLGSLVTLLGVVLFLKKRD